MEVGLVVVSKMPRNITQTTFVLSHPLLLTTMSLKIMNSPRISIERLVVCLVDTSDGSKCSSVSTIPFGLISDADFRASSVENPPPPPPITNHVIFALIKIGRSSYSAEHIASQRTAPHRHPGIPKLSVYAGGAKARAPMLGERVKLRAKSKKPNRYPSTTSSPPTTDHRHSPVRTLPRVGKLQLCASVLLLLTVSTHRWVGYTDYVWAPAGCF